MNRIVLFIGFLLLWMVNVSMGQSLPSTRSFTTRDGLASNVVNTVIQDRQGYIWIGTNLGLTRYDGYRFVNFFVEEKGMRLMQNVTRIVEDTEHKALLMSGNATRYFASTCRKCVLSQATALHFQFMTKGRCGYMSKRPLAWA